MFRDGLLHGLLVDVHDRFAERLVALLALGARMSGDRKAFFERLCQHRRLPFGVARHCTHLLIFHVVGAQGIAVTQQDLLSVQLQPVGIGQDGYAGLRGELLADHEIAVAVHEIDGHAAVRERAQRAFDRRVVLVGIVVTDPVLEEVAEDVERFGVGRFLVEEVEELLADFGAAGFEVQVGDKKCGHVSRRSPATSS